MLNILIIQSVQVSNTSNQCQQFVQNGQCVEKCQAPYNYYYTNTNECIEECTNAERYPVDNDVYLCVSCDYHQVYNNIDRVCEEVNQKNILDIITIIIISVFAALVICIVIIIIVTKKYKQKRQQQLQKLQKQNLMQIAAENDSGEYLKQFNSTESGINVSASHSAIDVTHSDFNLIINQLQDQLTIEQYNIK